MAPLKKIKSFENMMVSFWGKERYQKVKEIRIGIAGAGGLGSNCAANLIRSGFEKFVIADFDVIAGSNLNRQFYFADQVGMPKPDALKENLSRINPRASLECVQIKLDRENILQVFDGCDAVMEAFDNPLCKAMLFEVLGSKGVPLVGASGVAGFGDAESIKVRWINPKCAVVGDFVSEASERLLPMSPKVNAVAAIMADLLLGYFYKALG